MANRSSIPASASRTSNSKAATKTSAPTGRSDRVRSRLLRASGGLRSPRSRIQIPWTLRGRGQDSQEKTTALETDQTPSTTRFLYAHERPEVELCPILTSTRDVLPFLDQA